MNALVYIMLKFDIFYVINIIFLMNYLLNNIEVEIDID